MDHLGELCKYEAPWDVKVIGNTVGIFFWNTKTDKKFRCGEWHCLNHGSVEWPCPVCTLIFSLSRIGSMVYSFVMNAQAYDWLLQILVTFFLRWQHLLESRAISLAKVFVLVVLLQLLLEVWIRQQFSLLAGT